MGNTLNVCPFFTEKKDRLRKLLSPIFKWVEGSRSIFSIKVFEARMLVIIGLSSLPLSCQQHKELVPNGLKFVQVGDPMIPANKYKLKGKYLRDTVFQEEGYTWRAAILDYPTGKVYIEEDFYGRNIVSRIRIEASQLMFRQELCAGMSLEELKSLPWQWEVFYLENYKVWDLSSEAFAGLHLLVPAGSDFFDPEAVTDVEQLPEGSAVRSIVFL